MNATLGKRWFLIGFISLTIVAIYGTLMRYKIAFDFPFFQQKHLLHAHSHFAFSGWISHILYSGLALFIMPYLSFSRQKLYRILVNLNLVCAFGMLVFFTIQGYKFSSIAFSTLTIFIAIAFSILFIKDSKKLPVNHPSRRWGIVGLLLNILSSAGPFTLAYITMTKLNNSELYLGSVYYYLHFQYSGWFFFGSMALIVKLLPENFPSLKPYFWIFTSTAVPTFVLSILWAHPPMWLYIITVLATLTQTLAWMHLMYKGLTFFKHYPQKYPKWIVVFLFFSAFAITLKFLLQSLSVIPSLSHLVFGLRPIVIAYLHLVLLGVYSIFIISYCFIKNYIRASKFAIASAIVFIIGVFLNELFLAIQGFAAFAYIPIPHINELLLLAAFVLLFGAALIVVSQFNRFKSSF